MKNLTQELLNFLATSDVFYAADLFTFKLSDGTILRYTSADNDITYKSNIFYAFGPIVERGAIKESSGIDVDTLNITFYADTDDRVNSDLTILAAMANGNFDAAELSVERLYMPSWGDTSMGAIPQFDGRCDVDKVNRFSGTLRVKSTAELMNTKIPRNLYLPTCNWNIYDGNCGLDKASFTKTGKIISGTTEKTIKCDLSDADGYFNYGVIRFTSGVNSGLEYSVRSYTVGTIKIVPYLKAIPDDNDTFEIYPGCSRTIDGCKAKNNTSRGRFFHYIPKEDAVV